MSPIKDLQAAMATTYRIRLGHKVPTRNDPTKFAPANLNGAIRITSPAQEAVAAFTTVYGGDIVPWDRKSEGKPNEWQAIIRTGVLPIVILPGSTLVQWWEVYDSGGCVRRCDGFQQVVDHGTPQRPCQCPQPPESRMAQQPRSTPTDRLFCKPTTQILVVVPSVEVAGAGRLVSRGLIAAQQLPAALAIAEGFLDRGYRVPAYLRVVHHQGRRNYVVPQLDLIGVSINELDGAPTSRGAIGGEPLAGLSAARPGLSTATPALGAAPDPYGDYGSNSPPVPLPANELDPGRPFDDENETLIPIDRQRDFAKAVGAWAKERFPGPGITKTTEAIRHAIVTFATNGRTHSSKAILATEMPSLMGTFAALKDGRLVLDIGDNGAIQVMEPAPENGGTG